MAHVPGTTAEKLAWLRRQSAEGKLDGDDPEEIAQAKALLTMLARIAGGKEGRQKRHLDDLLDELETGEQHKYKRADFKRYLMLPHTSGK